MTERAVFDLTSEDLDTSFKLPEEGWHDVVIEEATEDVNKNGNTQYLLKYKSINETFKGLVWDYVTVTQASIQNIMSVSRAIGEEVPTKAKPGKYALPDPDDLVGKELQIKIEHKEDYNKKTDEEGNIIIRAQVGYGYGARKRIGEKTGVPASKAGTGAKATAKKATGFSV